MARYASGDAEAFDQLFRRYEPRAYAFFLKRTSSPQRAEDLYQELFLRIHRARNEFDSSRAFTPWFFQIAHRLLIDDQRRAFRAREVAANDFDAASALPTAESVAADREEVELLLDTLSPEERYVVVAAKMGGIGYPELADEFVILSAHYDHLGRAGWFGYYPGAADNARRIRAFFTILVISAARSRGIVMTDMPPAFSVPYQAIMRSIELPP